MSNKSDAMDVVYVPVAKLIPYERNPRFNDLAVNEVAKSIDAFGFKQPIVVDEQYTIIIGHTRYKAALFLGMDSVPVVVKKGLTEKQKNALRIADNKLGELSSWDFGKLGIEMSGFSDIEFASSHTGFTKEFIQSVMPDAGAITKDDDVVGRGDATPRLYYSSIIFNDGNEQERFYDIMFELRRRYPDASTAAERFLSFIEEFCK